MLRSIVLRGIAALLSVMAVLANRAFLPQQSSLRVSAQPYRARSLILPEPQSRMRR